MPIAQTHDQPRDGYEDEGPDLHLGLHTQTPPRVVGQAHQGSKRQSKQPVTVPEAPPAQVVITEAYLQSLLA